MEHQHTGRVDLYHADCFDVMHKIPDKSVNLILCDLPYGMTQNQWDKPLNLDDLWVQYKRIIADNGVIALFADGMFMAELMMSNKKMWKYNLVWDKVLTSGFLNAKRMPLRRHEEICIFYNKKATYTPQFTHGSPLHGKGSAYKAKTPVNNNYGKYSVDSDKRRGCTEKYPTSILTFPKAHPSKSIYPTQKSIECLRWLIRTYSNPKDTVLDNCMGSGSTGVACVLEERNFIGVEIDENAYNLAETRIYDAYQNA